MNYFSPLNRHRGYSSLRDTVGDHGKANLLSSFPKRGLKNEDLMKNKVRESGMYYVRICLYEDLNLVSALFTGLFPWHFYGKRLSFICHRIE